MKYTDSLKKQLEDDGVEFKDDGIDFPFQKISDDYAETDDDALMAAQKAFGITYLYPWQRIVIANILDAVRMHSKRDDMTSEDKNDLDYNGRQIVLLPTGAGKSLCFLTPSILLEGATLVLYPLLALMNDQKRRMDEGGIPNVIFKGGQTDEEREENFSKIKNGAKIILANPEVLQSEKLMERLSCCNIQHMAIDEAHCVSEWGNTFRPAYLNLGNVIEKINPPAVTAFTATASPSVLKNVSEVLFGNDAHIVRSDSDRPNIHYKVINTYAKKKTAFILALTEEKPLIIFCGTRAKSEDMAKELASYLGEDKVKFYHAGLERKEKENVEKWFYPKKDAILCCTCAFGMGVDKKDIHTVIHLEPSPTAESYIQEAGRGGRDGSIANAILLWSEKDSANADKFEKGSRERVLKDFAEAATCRRQILLDALGGEKTYCEGCDICVTGEKAPFAKDAELMIRYVQRHKNQLTEKSISTPMLKEFNSLYVKKFGMNIYEHEDIEEILRQLMHEGIIHTKKFPFKNILGVKGRFSKKNPFFRSSIQKTD